MKAKYLVLFGGLLLLTGCSKIAANYRVEPVLKPVPSSSGFITMKDDEVYVDTNSDAFQRALNDADNKTKKEKIAFTLMSLSDESCEKHKSLIISNANTWNITTGSLTNVLAGLGTVVGGESAKAALSAGAALSNSSRSLVNEEIYANALATTILRAIELKRNEVKKQIYAGLKDEAAATNYSAYQLIYDIDYYHQQCSFMVGMIEVSKALENRKPTKADIKQNIEFLQSQLPEAGANTAKLREKITTLQLAHDNATD
jgi:hypothetical protein